MVWFLPKDGIEQRAAATVVAVALGAIGYVARLPIDRYFRQYKERKALGSECKDLLRHLKASMNLVDQLVRRRPKDYDSLIRPIHISRIELLPGAGNFSAELYRDLPPGDVERIHRLKLMLRNLEADIFELKSIYATESCDEIYRYLSFLWNRLYYVHHIIQSKYAYLYEEMTPYEIEISYKQCDKDCVKRIEPHILFLRELVKNTPNASLDQIRTKLNANRGVIVSNQTIRKFMIRHGIGAG